MIAGTGMLWSLIRRPSPPRERIEWPIYVLTVTNYPDSIPGPDAASTDLNKIVRGPYSVPFNSS